MSNQYITNLASKFDTQFNDINNILDKVIERNSKMVDIVKGEDRQHSYKVLVNNENVANSNFERVNQGKNTSTSPYVNVQEPEQYNLDKGSLQDLVRGNEVKKNSGYYDSPLSSGENLPRTPVKNRKDDDGYEYGYTSYSTPRGEVVKQGENSLNKTQPSTVMASRGVASTPQKSFGASDNTNVFESPQRFSINNGGYETPDKCKLPRRNRDVEPPKLVEQNLQNLETDLKYGNKYTPLKTIKTIEQSPDGKYFLVDSVKKDRSVNNSAKKSNISEDPIDQIIVLSSPEREIKPSENLVSIYQQVSEVYNDGTSYIGEKFLGLRQGKGTYYFHNGYRYEGSWDEDKMSGFGVLFIADDIKWYEGEWKNNTFNGRGIIYNLTPEEIDGETQFSKDLNQVGNGWAKYEGMFENGAKQGFGTLFLSNGDTFTGNFNSDNVDGKGSYVRVNRKSIVAGIWANNVLKTVF